MHNATEKENDIDECGDTVPPAIALVNCSRSEDTVQMVIDNLRHHRRVLALISRTNSALDGEGRARLESVRGVGIPRAGFVLHTSGSTGRPRSMCVSTEQIVDYAASIQHIYEIRESDVIVICNHVESDYFLEETGIAAYYDIPSVVVPEGVSPADPQFTDLIKDGNVSVVILPLGAWRLWNNELQYANQSVPECVRALVVGGEKLVDSDLDSLIRKSREGQLLINAYGPTETTVATHFDRISRTLRRKQYSIGRPRSGVVCRIVPTPRSLELFGQGVGELLIGGAAVVKGYLWDDPATERKFEVDASGTRWFKTGDAVREGADGSYDFFGRLDRMFKDRGWLFDAAEIEAQLRKELRTEYLVVVGLSSTESRRHLDVIYDRGNPPSAQPTSYPLTPSQEIALRWLPATDVRKTPGAKVVVHDGSIHDQAGEYGE